MIWRENPAQLTFFKLLGTSDHFTLFDKPQEAQKSQKKPELT